MKVLFMGTPDFAAVSLRCLLSAGCDLAGVVTQPDRPRGRGMELQFSAVKELALGSGLRVWQPEKVAAPAFLSEFREIRPGLVVVVAFGQKIPAEILFEPECGCVNVHGSLLPYYRGAAPVQWSLLNGDTETGVTTMYMNEGWDTGDIIFQTKTLVPPDENFGSLYGRLAELGGELLVETLAAIARREAPRIPQDHSRATLAPKLKPTQEQIEWAESAWSIHNRVRAFAPEPGAETFFVRERFKIIRTELETGAEATDNRIPGEIAGILKNRGIVVRTGYGNLLVTEVQPAGKKVMPATAFANGRRLAVGMRFGA